MAERFKQNDVEADFGTPFVSGKSILQLRPSDLSVSSLAQYSTRR